MMAPVLPFRRPFHFIFCRNVLTYCDEETKRRLVPLFHGHGEPGGYLFVGHSGTLRGFDHPFRYAGPAIYGRV